MYNNYNMYFKNYFWGYNMLGVMSESFSIGTTIITLINILLVILFIYIIKLITKQYSKIKQLEKDIGELKNNNQEKHSN